MSSFASMGVALSDAVAKDLNGHVEGWAAGLYLCALAMQRDRIAAGVSASMHSDRFVSDYFFGELAGLPEDSARLPERVVGAHPDVSGTLRRGALPY